MPLGRRSPRFLLVAGESERAHQLVRQIFAVNGRVAPSPLMLRRPPLPHDADGDSDAASHDSETSEGGHEGSERAGRYPYAKPGYQPRRDRGAGSAFKQLFRQDMYQQTLTCGFCQAVCTMVFCELHASPLASPLLPHLSMRMVAT